MYLKDYWNFLSMFDRRWMQRSMLMDHLLMVLLLIIYLKWGVLSSVNESCLLFPSFLRHCPAVDPQGTSPFICPYIYLYHANSPSLDVFYKKLPFPYYFPMPVLLSPQSRSQYFTPSWMFLTWLTFMAALCFHILQKNAIKLPSTCWPRQ